MSVDEFSRREAAKYTGVAVPTLASWRSRNKGPRSFKAPNGRVRYAKADLDQYLADRKAATIRGDQ